MRTKGALFLLYLVDIYFTLILFELTTLSVGGAGCELFILPYLCSPKNSLKIPERSVAFLGRLCEN